MSTPVSITPKAHLRKVHSRTDSEQRRDIQAQLQRMITLQNEEQHLSERDVGLGSSFENEPPQRLPSGQEEPRSIGLANRTNTEMMSLNAMGAGESDAIYHTSTPWPSENNRLPPPNPQQGIGRGTLYFSNTLSGAEPSERLQINAPQQMHADYGAVPDQHHEFHYGNPDYHDPFDAMRDMKRRQDRSFCEKCCCLYRPLVNILSQEHLHRSFCFGAIDGILTGSGIVSAFCALNVLTVTTPWEIRLAVVAFTAAACTADSMCMAIGHIWTSFVVSSGHAHERSKERKLLDTNKHDAKAKLVDMLLARGMLKIDAMSLADTLEGYPDLFVSALVGDSLLAGHDEGDDETSDGGSGRAPSGGSFGGWKFSSYGQFDEMEHDPDAGDVNMVVAESQREGVFMMMGFAMFALIPSILWLYLPLITPPPPTGHHVVQQGSSITLPSLVISISAVIMWFLGVWKSHFLDSNWVVFGVETVVVLLICVISAYGVGLVLSVVLGGGIEGVTLTNAPPS